MQIIIDIPEESYKFAKECKSKGSSKHSWNLSHDNIVLMVANGKPLPKGYGRLKVLSEDVIKREQTPLSFSCQKWISEVGLSNATVTIIEADKEEREEVKNEQLQEGQQ